MFIGNICKLDSFHTGTNLLGSCHPYVHEKAEVQIDTKNLRRMHIQCLDKLNSILSSPASRAMFLFPAFEVLKCVVQWLLLLSRKEERI